MNLHAVSYFSIFLIQEENIGKQQQKIKKPIPGKPKGCASISTD